MNERQIIEYIADLAGKNPDNCGLIQGIGDDCAVVAKDGRMVWLLTMDTLIEKVHFAPAFHPPKQLGRKAISVNVSDIAAMGGKPLFVLLSLGLPTSFEDAWYRDFASGLIEACREYGCVLIGGDTVASPQGFNCSLTLIGEMEREHVLYRSGARPGDTIWVSGTLGYAAAGLELLTRGAEKGRGFAPLCDRHLDPLARVALGGLLSESELVHAMMDLSDGLATDLAHLCHRSGVGARLVAEQLPGLAGLAEAADMLGKDPVTWAISGGEDYELLFTAAAEAHEHLLTLSQRCGLPLTPVGTITTGQEVLLQSRRADGRIQEQLVSYLGYDHFRRKGD